MPSPPPLAAGLFDRLRAIDWFVQVFASDEQWAAIAEPSAAQRRAPADRSFRACGPDEAARSPGFQAVLALGREGRAAIKLSAPFRHRRAPVDRL